MRLEHKFLCILLLELTHHCYVLVFDFSNDIRKRMRGEPAIISSVSRAKNLIIECKLIRILKISPVWRSWMHFTYIVSFLCMLFDRFKSVLRHKLVFENIGVGCLFFRNFKIFIIAQSHYLISRIIFLWRTISIYDVHLLFFLFLYLFMEILESLHHTLCRIQLLFLLRVLLQDLRFFKWRNFVAWSFFHVQFIANALPVVICFIVRITKRILLR